MNGKFCLNNVTFANGISQFFQNQFQMRGKIFREIKHRTPFIFYAPPQKLEIKDFFLDFSNLIAE